MISVSTLNPMHAHAWTPHPTHYAQKCSLSNVLPLCVADSLIDIVEPYFRHSRETIVACKVVTDELVYAHTQYEIIQV